MRRRGRALAKRYGRRHGHAAGPAMLSAARYVEHHPGVTILPVADAIGPHGSTKYGYAAVHRAIKAGLILAARMSDGTYRLYPNK
jgi:hypothetical protein